ncbi:MAG: MFS transporter, partial [Actinobacteria bacterium]|nr:MFS transporter [Actinomycetota bacterium]
MSWRDRLPPALRRRDYALLWVTTLLTGTGAQMIAVAVGWQVYAIHKNPFDLGLIGLMEFVPLPLLALPAGQLSDRVSRKRVIAVSIVLDTAIVVLLLVVTLTGAHRLWPFLALAAATGVSASIGWPALRALPPVLVPMEILPSAMALRSISFQVATVAGPALGGLIFAASPDAVYATAAALFVLAFACAIAMRIPPIEVREVEPLGWNSVLAGIHFIRRTPMLLGAISLDLFAVLFGGAIALAPVFARSILHTGPLGLGALRSAPAVGAVAAGVWLTRKPLQRHAGRTLLLVVGAFGVSMVVFGISRSLPLSLAALAVSGFVDMISMNIRGTTVAVATPDALRGRVLAVEMVFISASNELGAFESGVAAALVGAVTAVVAGGALTIGLAASWVRLFPALAHI